jgi:Fe-S-cluster containining protein
LDSHRPDFNCKKCGKCCRGFSGERGVIIWPSDAERISDYMGMQTERFLNTYCLSKEIELKKGKVIVHLLKSIDGACVFLSHDNLCLIHDFKPLQCARTPFDFFWDHRHVPEYECLENIDLSSMRDTSGKDKVLIESLKIVN